MMVSARSTSGSLARVWVALLAVVVSARLEAGAQSPEAELEARVMSTVSAALAPALPFPRSDDAGLLPVDGSPTASWMVRPLQSGEVTIEVLANPLNVANQARAAKAMVQIEAAIEAAQRRSQIAYEKALADAQRTGRSQDVAGITLGDEGVAGARIDADAHVTIDVEFNRAAYSYAVGSSIEPAPPAAPMREGIAAIHVPANVYREGRDTATNERFCAAEMHLFFGAVLAPEVHKRSNVSFEVSAASAAMPAEPSGVRSLAITLRGNADLIDQIIRQADWGRVQALVASQ